MILHFSYGAVTTSCRHLADPLSKGKNEKKKRKRLEFEFFHAMLLRIVSIKNSDEESNGCWNRNNKRITTIGREPKTKRFTWCSSKRIKSLFCQTVFRVETHNIRTILTLRKTNFQQWSSLDLLPKKWIQFLKEIVATHIRSKYNCTRS